MIKKSNINIYEAMDDLDLFGDGYSKNGGIS